MKLKHRILVLIFFPAAIQAAIIEGQIRNATPGTKIDVIVPHRYIDGHDSYFSCVLDGKLQFSVEVMMPEPQLAFLVFNDDRLPVFLSQQDTLFLKADAFQYPLSIGYFGNAAANNRLLQQYLRQYPLDFNEFNNIRFKVGQYWAAVEMSLNDQMERLWPPEFKGYLDSLKSGAIMLYEKAEEETPGAITPVFAQWYQAETTYFWAYHLLVYGHVYSGRYTIQPEYFDFLYEAPIINESIGSDWYRQFLLAFMARQQSKVGSDGDSFWSGQYQLAGKLLSGKARAFIRSEVISTAFSAEKYQDLLPIYTHFLQNNEFPSFDEKVEGLYQKYARILPGVAAPDFELADANGKPISLSQLHGKVVYLNFWASWCGACLRKMDIMDEYEAEFLSQGIEIINISIDEQAANWRAALSEHHFNGRNVLASHGQPRNLAALYSVEAIPQYFIIGRNGDFEDKAAASQPGEIREQLLRVATKR